MTDAELQAMRERDEKSAATWYSRPLGRPESGPAQCFVDRRALIAHAIQLRAALAWLRDGTGLTTAEVDGILDPMLGIEKPAAPPIANFANRADPDQQQAEGDDDADRVPGT